LEKIISIAIMAMGGPMQLLPAAANISQEAAAYSLICLLPVKSNHPPRSMPGLWEDDFFAC